MSSTKSNTHCLPLRVDALLGTNQVPSPMERCSILSILVEPEEKLRVMRAKIEEIQEQLEDLILSEENLALKIAPYRALLSPFRKLNDDILKEICLACLPDGHAPVIDNRQPPLLLTQISSRLRRITLSTPRLWTAISIPIVLPCLTRWRDGRDSSREIVSEQTMLKYTMAVNEWLGRTGACEVEIFVHEFGNDSADRYIEGIFKTLITLANRWKSISLHCSGYSVQKFFTMLGQSYSEFDFPKLQHLSLAISGPYFLQEDPEKSYNYTSHFPHASKLHSIRLVLPEGNYAQYHCQWWRLTYLSMGSASYPSPLAPIVKVLDYCKNLVSCKLYVKMDGTDLRTRLPYLKSLSLFFDQAGWFDAAFYQEELLTDAYSLCNNLDTPLLERITYDASVDFLPLLGLLHRLGNHITHLAVTHFEEPVELIQCLKSCPRLISLDVSRPDGIMKAIRTHCEQLGDAPWVSSLASWTTGGDQLLRYLMAAGGTDKMVQIQLCPHLEYLSYHVRDGPMSCEEIKAFILEKSKGGSSRLKGLSAIVRGGQENLEWLRRSVDKQLLAGLRLLLLPLETAGYRRMEHSTHPVMKQLKWWEEERHKEAQK